MGKQLQLFWGSLPASMFTLFKSICGGLSWHDCIIPLNDLGLLYVGLFTIFIAFSVFAVMNVVTAVFCQSAIESAQNDRDLVTMDLLKTNDKLYKQFVALFGEMDSDGSRSITMNEVEDVLMQPYTHAYLQSLGICVTDAWTLLKLIDKDRSGTIDLEEFVHGCMSLQGEAKAVHVATLAYDQCTLMEALEGFMDSVNQQLERLLYLSSTS